MITPRRIGSAHQVLRHRLFAVRMCFIVRAGRAQLQTKIRTGEHRAQVPHNLATKRLDVADGLQLAAIKSPHRGSSGEQIAGSRSAEDRRHAKHLGGQLRISIAGADLIGGSSRSPQEQPSRPHPRRQSRHDCSRPVIARAPYEMRLPPSRKWRRRMLILALEFLERREPGIPVIGATTKPKATARSPVTEESPPKACHGQPGVDGRGPGHAAG